MAHPVTEAVRPVIMAATDQWSGKAWPTARTAAGTGHGAGPHTPVRTGAARRYYFCQPIVTKLQSPSPGAPKFARPERTARICGRW